MKLQATDAEVPDFEAREGDEIEIWGVVTT